MRMRFWANENRISVSDSDYFTWSPIGNFFLSFSQRIPSILASQGCDWKHFMKDKPSFLSLCSFQGEALGLFLNVIRDCTHTIVRTGLNTLTFLRYSFLLYADGTILIYPCGSTFKRPRALRTFYEFNLGRRRFLSVVRVSVLAKFTETFRTPRVRPRSSWRSRGISNSLPNPQFRILDYA